MRVRKIKNNRFENTRNSGDNFDIEQDEPIPKVFESQTKLKQMNDSFSDVEVHEEEISFDNTDRLESRDSSFERKKYNKVVKLETEQTECEDQQFVIANERFNYKPEVIADKKHFKPQKTVYQNSRERYEQRMRNWKSVNDFTKHARILSRNENKSTGRLIPRVANLDRCSNQGPIRKSRIIETLNDHFREWTFKPKISGTSNKIISQKRKQVMQNFSFMKQSIMSQSRESLNDRTNIQDHPVHSTFDHRKRSVAQPDPSESILGSFKMNSWLNRSIDQWTHSRLYNDAKYHNARKMHLKRMHKIPGHQECTFQPKLVTGSQLNFSLNFNLCIDSSLTMKMWNQRTKSIERRDELINQSIANVYPVKSKQEKSRNFKENHFVKPRSMLVEYREKEKKKEREEYLRLVRQQQQKQGKKRYFIEEIY